MPKRKASKKKTKEKDVLDQRIEHFGEEVGMLGEKFGERMEKKGKGWESWFHRTFGIVGPLISTAFGILILSIFVWIMYFVNNYIGFTFLDNLYSFFVGNIGWFFLIFLFFSYSSYFSKASPKAYRPISPIVTAAGITIGFWIAAQAMNVANLSLGIGALTVIAFYIESNIPWIFGFFVFIGYMFLLIKLVVEKPREVSVKEEKVVMKKEVGRKSDIRRLYRSGKDRILGGVCGGIAEYLGVDPVIIRLLWIVGTLAWGAGIILYIIFWIVIPRNPKHEWKD